MTQTQTQIPPHATALAVRESDGWTAEDLDALRQTIGRDLSLAEFKVFIAAARRLGLDPFARQVYGLKQGDRMTIQVSIDGFRLIAERTGQYVGQLGPFWCGPDGEWKEVWLAKDAPAAAKVGVLRRDFVEPMWGVARFASYSSGRSTWAKLPDVMLAKVAESLALRRAFPAELSGVYTREEMAQADAEHDEPEPSPPPPTRPPSAPRVVEAAPQDECDEADDETIPYTPDDDEPIAITAEMEQPSALQLRRIESLCKMLGKEYDPSKVRDAQHAEHIRVELDRIYTAKQNAAAAEKKRTRRSQVASLGAVMPTGESVPESLESLPTGSRAS